MRHAHIVNTSRLAPDECVSSLQPEAGSAVSDLVEPPQPLTITRWTRVQRFIRRALRVKSLQPTIKRTP